MSMIVLWDPIKNEWLKRERNVSFEQAKHAIETNSFLDDLVNPTRPNQRVYVVELNGYVCSVPYVIEGEMRFLKTIFPNRDLHAKYGGRNDKTKT